MSRKKEKTKTKTKSKTKQQQQNKTKQNKTKQKQNKKPRSGLDSLRISIGYILHYLAAASYMYVWLSLGSNDLGYHKNEH